ncbi:MAG: hypothetical protein WCZ87_12200 [Thiohalobacteraceae bacterium]
MTQVFHQLRTHHRVLAHGLLLVLLATWLAAACPHCLAEAAQPREASEHCYSEAPPPAGHSDQQSDSCPAFGAMLCDEGACAQLSPADIAESTAVVTTETSAQIHPATADARDAWPPRPPPTAVPAAIVTVEPCPLYLRHCSFLN